MASVEIIDDTEADPSVVNVEKKDKIHYNGWVDVPFQMNDALPECVKRRINALKNIQIQCGQLEGKFYVEAHQLEMKFAEMYKTRFQKRSDIINGLYEPNDEEGTWIEPGEKEKVEELVVKEITSHPILNGYPTGIPRFWLTAMKNSELLKTIIKEHDEYILEHLTDITIKLTGKEESESEITADVGFILEFRFSPNDYFTNTILRKAYAVEVAPDPDDPFSFQGPHIVASTGCHIDWNEGRNVTKKQVKRKQKRKGQGESRFVTKFVRNESFFNFFEPLKIPEDEEEIDDEVEALIILDFEIGYFFREHLVPRAVLYYTGEENDDDSDSDEVESSIEIIESNTNGSSNEDDTDDDNSDSKQTNCKQQ